MNDTPGRLESLFDCLVSAAFSSRLCVQVRFGEQATTKYWELFVADVPYSDAGVAGCKLHHH